MTTLPTPTQSFKPVHDAHAIERVFIGIQFDRLLDETSFLEIRAKADLFKADLPKQVEIQGLVFAFGTQPGLPPPPPTTSGFILQNVERDGAISFELRIETNAVMFSTDRYTQWDDIWTNAKKYLDILVPIYLGKTRLSSLHLKYLDKFVWDGSLENFKPELLLHKNSAYICPHVYTSEDLWHSHTGKFIRVGDKIKRLLNINLDCLDEKGSRGNQERVIRITTVVTDNFNQPNYTATTIEPNEVIDVINQYMCDMHTFSKKVFGEVIDIEMCKRIGLIE